MTQPILITAATLLGVGVSAWCGWHCLRGIRAMRHGQAASRCGATPASSHEQLAQLRGELAELKAARTKQDSRSGP